jgi:hypothetical protein
MCQIKVVEKTRTHILCSVTSFRKLCCLLHNVEKYGGAREAADNWHLRVACWISKATRSQAHSLDRAPTPPHTLGICYSYRFSTATVVSWKHLSVTLYVHCMSCCVLFAWIWVLTALIGVRLWSVASFIFIPCRSTKFNRNLLWNFHLRHSVSPQCPLQS